MKDQLKSNKSTLTNLIKEANKEFLENIMEEKDLRYNISRYGKEVVISFLEQQIRKTWKAARKDYLNLDFKKMEKVAKRINMTDEQAHSIIEKARREKK